jgi:hypothetical protein
MSEAKKSVAGGKKESVESLISSEAVLSLSPDNGYVGNKNSSSYLIQALISHNLSLLSTVRQSPT